MGKRKTRKIIIYVMLFAMLASTIFTGLAAFL